MTRIAGSLRARAGRARWRGGAHLGETDDIDRWRSSGDRLAGLDAEGARGGVAEQRVLGRGERGVDVEQPLRPTSTAFQELGVLGQNGDAGLGASALAHPGELALAAQLP